MPPSCGHPRTVAARGWLSTSTAGRVTGPCPGPPSPCSAAPPVRSPGIVVLHLVTLRDPNLSVVHLLRHFHRDRAVRGDEQLLLCRALRPSHPRMLLAPSRVQ